MLKYNNNNDQTRQMSNVDNIQQQQEFYENINFESERRASTSTFDNNPAEVYSVINTEKSNNHQPPPSRRPNPQKVNSKSNPNKEIKHKINTQYLTSILGLINILLIVRTFPYHFFI